MAYFHLSVTTGHQRDHCEGRRRPYESSHRVCFCIVAAGRRGCLAATAIVRATDERLASTGVYADKDTNKRGQCQILFEHCRAGVSKAQPKIRISGGNVKLFAFLPRRRYLKRRQKLPKSRSLHIPKSSKTQNMKHWRIHRNRHIRMEKTSQGSDSSHTISPPPDRIQRGRFPS